MYIHNITNLNLNPNHINDCKVDASAAMFLDKSREVNVFITAIIIIVGLVGNILGVVVFIQKRFRQKSQEVFLLALAISDGLFLLTHFFEDTLRTYIDIYVRNNLTCNRNNFNQTASNFTFNGKNIFLIINITDNFEIICRLVNFMRYVLRFISAYIITIFTIQRTIAVYFPLCQKKISSPNLAWKIASGLIIIAAILCSCVPFLFQLNQYPSNRIKFSYCDTDKNYNQIYFITTIIYIVLIMFIPITTIITCNTLIIFRVCNETKKRSLMISGNFIEYPPNKNRLFTKHANSYFGSESNIQSDDAVEFVKSNIGKKQLKKISSDSHKITRMLIIMSLSFAILNLPYFITWCIFYYTEAINGQKASSYLIGSINVTEIFYVLNYGIHFFFILCEWQKVFETTQSFAY